MKHQSTIILVPQHQILDSGADTVVLAGT